MSLLLLVALLALSRWVHRRLLGAFGAGTMQHLVRLPGNLAHELAHALALYATGYTVRGLRVSLFDPAGRGGVTPGPAWTRYTRPWLANLVSPVAPLVGAVFLLSLLAGWSGAPGLPTTPAAVLPVLRRFPWTEWQLWVGLALAFSVAAELAPSDIDLAAWWRPALVLGLVAAAALYASSWLAPGGALAVYAQLDSAVGRPLARAVGMAVWSAAAVGPVAAFAGWRR